MTRALVSNLSDLTDHQWSVDYQLATPVLEHFISTPYDCDTDIFYNSSIIITFLRTRCRQNIMFKFIQRQKMRQDLNELRWTNQEGSTMSMNFPSQIIFCTHISFPNPTNPLVVRVRKRHISDQCGVL